MSEKQLLIDIIDRVKAECPSIKHVAKWNNQVGIEDNENREIPFGYPAVFVHIRMTDWEDIRKGCQRGLSTVDVRVVSEKYNRDDIDFYDYVIEVNQALHLWNHTVKGMLMRTTSEWDADHDNVIMHLTTFTTDLIDKTTATERDYIELSPTPDLEIQSDLDIDNDIIRTGDGDFTT